MVHKSIYVQLTYSRMHARSFPPLRGGRDANRLDWGSQAWREPASGHASPVNQSGGSQFGTSSSPATSIAARNPLSSNGLPRTCSGVIETDRACLNVSAPAGNIALCSVLDNWAGSQRPPPAAGTRETSQGSTREWPILAEIPAKSYHELSGGTHLDQAWQSLLNDTTWVDPRVIEYNVGEYPLRPYSRGCRRHAWWYD